MSTINPAGLYSQNEGIFNARPYVQHEQELQAKQAAKDNAISDYYEALPNKVNGAGLAYEDVEGLSNLANKNRQFWIQNSKAINKGLTPENANYMQAIRDSHAYIEKGKDKVKELNLGNQLRQKKGFEYLNNDKGFTDALASGSLPINDPNYKPFKSSAFEIPRSPYDINKNNKFYDAIKPDMTDVTYEPIEGSKIQQTEVRTPKLNIDQFNKVHQQATSELYDDDRVGTYVKGWLDKNPDQLPLMNKVFEKSSGHPIRPYSDGDAVTAYRLLNMGMAATSKTVPNAQGAYDQKLADKRKDATTAFGRSLVKIDANNNNLPQASQGNAFDDVTGNVAGKNGRPDMSFKKGLLSDKDGNLYTGNDVEMDKVNVPAGVINNSKKNGQSFDRVPKVRLEIKDGQIMSMYHPQIGTINRSDQENNQNNKVSKTAVPAKYGNATRQEVPNKQKQKLTSNGLPKL